MPFGIETASRNELVRGWLPLLKSRTELLRLNACLASAMRHAILGGVKPTFALLGVILFGGFGLGFAAAPVAPSASPRLLRLATFDVDATPPIGSFMAYDPVTNKW